MFRKFGHKTGALTRMMQSAEPSALAQIKGDSAHSQLHGTVSFYPFGNRTLVVAEVFGLPAASGNCSRPVLGFHIHAGEACSGTPEEPFKDADGHFNQGGCDHPYHAGDMPPLFANDGYAFSAFLTDRFTIDEVIGRTVIIHADPDDFTTQPSGNAGPMIACGVIRTA